MTPQMRHVTFILPAPLDRRLRISAAEQGISRSSLIRQILAKAAHFPSQEEHDAPQDTLVECVNDYETTRARI